MTRADLQGFHLVVDLVLVRRLDEVTVVATLLQLHHDVQEARRTAFGTFTQSFVVPGQDPPDGRERDGEMLLMVQLFHDSLTRNIISSGIGRSPMPGSKSYL